MGGLINVMEPCCAAGGGGISAADLAGGTLPASLTTLATSGVASLSGLTLGSAAYPSRTITFQESEPALVFRISGEDKVLVDYQGVNLNQYGVITWSGGTSQATARNLQLSRNGESRMGLGAYNVGDDGALELGAIRKKAYTVGTLPIAPLLYDECLVTDALTPTRDSPVVAGGAVVTGVRWVSPNWLVM